MDDFRKRYDVPRRDYGMPVQPQPSQPPQYQQPAQPASQPYSQPSLPEYQPPAAPTEQAQEYQPAYHRPAVPVGDAEEPKSQPKPKAGLKKAAIAAAIAVVLIGGAIFVLKPAKTIAVIPADLAKKASFDVYYPSSLPTGYDYREDLATYENDGAYYTFVKGPKHIIIRENVTSTGKLDTNEVTDPQPLETPVGSAVLGTNTGQTAAAVLAGRTYIFIYSNGSVPREEVTAIVQKLKNLSQNN